MWHKPPSELHLLPLEPGVYRMLDKQQQVLYVGKARVLRRRVSSYFQRCPESARIQAMVQQVAAIDFSICDSEVDALILEHHLIKQLRPRYNVLLKDSKSYPYIHLTDDVYPRLSLFRGQPKKRKGLFFGPFPNVHAVRHAMDVMQTVFRLRDCENSVFANRSRPCMQYQIGRCTAPCCSVCSETEYALQVREAKEFLQGKNDHLLQVWEAEMQQASERLAFERAALLCQRIQSLRSIVGKLEKSSLPEHADLFYLSQQKTGVSMAVAMRRQGQDFGCYTLDVQQAEGVDALEIWQRVLIERYRQQLPPAVLYLDLGDEDRKILQATLKLLQPSQPTHCLPIKRGAVKKWYEHLQKHLQQSELLNVKGHQQAAFEVFAERFQLTNTPKIIAAIDNAHLGGSQMVSAIAVADWYGPIKDEYRRYKLIDVPAGDDYAAMEASLQRYFAAILEGRSRKPDVLLVDGGKGQLKAAQKAADKQGLQLAMMGVAKGSSRKLGDETLWPNWLALPQAMQLDRHDPALLLLARVRDEAHRFAGAYLRKRKKSSMLQSSLEKIEGIGARKRSALLKHFGGIEGVKKASRAQLAEAEGISTILAEKVFKALHR